MSLAKEYVNDCKFEKNGKVLARVTPMGFLKWTSQYTQVTPEDALLLAAWIVKVFGEGQTDERIG